jgi:hypothetical protein
MALDDTLAGILLLTDANNDPIDVTDLLEAAPLLKVLPAKKSSHGTSHKYMKETTAPGVGFRAVDTGITNSAGEETQVTVTLAFLDATVRRDIAKAKAFGDMSKYMMHQAEKSLKTAFAHVEQQIIDGTGNEADGFSGLANATAVDDVGDAMVIDAGGAAGNRNVYLIRAGLDDVCLLYADENVQMSDVYRVESNSGAYTKLVVDIDAYLGLQIGSIYSVARIYNLDGTAGNTLDDDLISQALALAPVGRPFTHIIMDRTSLKELQQSRTATNVTGAPAPFPTEAFGVPIVVTDNIDLTNTVATTTT